jgi:hypothetical protein
LAEDLAPLKLKPIVLLDINVFVYGFEFPNSNSRLIIDDLSKTFYRRSYLKGSLKKFTDILESFYSKELADEYRVYIFSMCQIVIVHEIRDKNG